MKLNKKGFTLIELLAVIVILAIIMLIATPIILNVIEDARQGAARSSAMGYVNAIEKEIMAKQVTGDAGDLMNTTIIDPSIISIRGERPDEVTLYVSNGLVTGGTIRFDKYIFTVSDDGTVSLHLHKKD